MVFSSIMFWFRFSGTLTLVLSAMLPQRINLTTTLHRRDLYEEIFLQNISNNNASLELLEYEKRRCQQSSIDRFISKNQQSSLTNSLSISDTFSMEDIVKIHYMSLPYPFVSPERLQMENHHYRINHKKIPFRTYPSNDLQNINQFLYHGSNQFRDKYRVLFPGGGTGGPSVFVAEQLNHTNGEVLYIDFSIQSKAVAQLRAQIRNLGNVIWISDWIESIPFLGLAFFDLVSCTGVIHHMKNPRKGVCILKDTQLSSGGANLMVYAKYGRTGIYPIQELTKKLNHGVSTMKEELTMAKIVIKSLPKHHWFNSNYYTDHKSMGDVGIYDLLLHKRDICYDILELNKLIDNGGYVYINFDNVLEREAMVYRPKAISTATIESIVHSSKFNRMLIGEISIGKITTHSVYIIKDQYE